MQKHSAISAMPIHCVSVMGCAIFLDALDCAIKPMHVDGVVPIEVIFWFNYGFVLRVPRRIPPISAAWTIPAFITPIEINADILSP